MELDTMIPWCDGAQPVVLMSEEPAAAHRCQVHQVLTALQPMSYHEVPLLAQPCRSEQSTQTEDTQYSAKGPFLQPCTQASAGPAVDSVPREEVDENETNPFASDPFPVNPPHPKPTPVSRAFIFRLGSPGR